MLLLQTVSILIGISTVVVEAVEVPVPERYLRPRDYNPHPLQTLLNSPLDLGLVLQRHPYHYLTRPEGRDRQPVQFPDVPAPPPTAKPTKSRTPGYITVPVPKNYAFSYAVKDRQSGDDFSHQQAHNGHATKGEYRVKLPDGRTQIVSYTADNHGYKADVRYDGEAKPDTNVYYTPPSQGLNTLTNSILQEEPDDYQEEPEVVYKQPVQIVYKQNSLAQQYTNVHVTPRPLEVLFSPTPRPYKALAPQQVQYRTLPQTAEEYTSSETPGYYQAPSNLPGYFTRTAGPTEATPIVEEQDDVPAPPKPSVSARLYAGSTPPPQGVRYFFVTQSTPYDYNDS